MAVAPTGLCLKDGGGAALSEETRLRIGAAEEFAILLFDLA